MIVFHHWFELTEKKTQKRNSSRNTQWGTKRLDIQLHQLLLPLWPLKAINSRETWWGKKLHLWSADYCRTRGGAIICTGSCSLLLSGRANASCRQRLSCVLWASCCGCARSFHSHYQYPQCPLYPLPMHTIQHCSHWFSAEMTILLLLIVSKLRPRVLHSASI